MNWARILETAARQRGLLTLPQLKAAGATHDSIKQSVAARRLWSLRRGVYSMTQPSGAFSERVMAACLHPSVDLVAASGLTAAHLWGFWEEPDRLEVSVRYPAQIRVGDGVRVHRSRDLTRAHVTRLDSIPTTSPERTLVDLGRALPEPEVLRMLEHAVVAGLVDIGRLWQARRTVGVQGRTGAGVIDRAIMALHPDATSTESGPEAGLLRLLEAHGFPTPECQWWVTVGPRRFRLDFAYPQALLGIEYDGAEWHDSPEQRASDHERDELLAAAGWEIVRIRADDLRPHRRLALFTALQRQLRERSPVL